MKKKWIVFAAVVLFLSAAGLGLYQGTPSIPKRSREQTVPVQPVAALTGYAKEEALRKRFLGVLSRKEAVKVQLDPGRETEGFLAEAGDLVTEGSILAIYDNSALLLEKEQLLLDREQRGFELESGELQIRTLKRERSQAEAARRGDYDLQILNAEAEQERKEYELGRKDREIAALEEKLEEHELLSPCKGTVAGVDREGGSLSIVPEDEYVFTLSAGEEEIKEFRAGDAVSVTSRDESFSIEGKVERVGTENSAGDEAASGAARASMYPVSGTVTEADGFLQGQHVYIEKVQTGGETEKGEGNQEGRETEILLPEGYVEDSSGEPWV